MMTNSKKFKFKALGPGIDKIPSNISLDVTVIALEHATFTHLKFQSFKQFTKLQIIKLYDGQISNIHPGAFEGFGIQRQKWTSYGIFLTGNKLHDLKSEMWQGISTLNTLFLNNNYVSMLRRGTFSTLEGRNVNLRKLNLCQNSISVVENGTWSGLTQLSVLNLSRNKLKALPPNIFSGLESLTDLNLDDNMIAIIDQKALAGVPVLSTLTLVCNQLDTFITDSLQYRNGFHNLTQVSVLFSCNPLKCGPEICWMMESEAGLISTDLFDLSDFHLICQNKDHPTLSLFSLDQAHLNCSQDTKDSFADSEGKFGLHSVVTQKVMFVIVSSSNICEQRNIPAGDTFLPQ